MKNNLLPSLAGVLVSLFAVWWLHGFLLVDRCLDSGGLLIIKQTYAWAQTSK